MTRDRFAAVFERGRVQKGTPVGTRSLLGSGLVGVAVPKKSRTKPRRNRIKRRILAAYRAAEVHHPSLDLVLVASLASYETPFPELTQVIRERILALMTDVGGE
ncbi:MAG: hypothetical protein C4320_08625 [Armatimonadota bacterium]